MADYKLTHTGYIQRTADGALIPPDEMNGDYKEYLKWLEDELNVPDAADPKFEDTWPGVREKRDLLLSKTDWTQMADSPLSTQDKTDYATYRQELRDIPQTYTNVEDVVWPTEPE